MKKAFFLPAFLVLLFSAEAHAHKDSGGAESGRLDEIAQAGESKWSFNYLYERADWRERAAEDAARLAADGRGIDNKLYEEFHFFTLGLSATDSLTITAEVPWVRRVFQEIEDPARIGAREVSEGFGDATVLGELSFDTPAGRVAPVFGAQLPTAETHEESSGGSRFGTGLQPGTGSFGWILGGIWGSEWRGFQADASASYALKGDGAQSFEPGDVFNGTVSVSKTVLECKRASVTAGFDFEYEHEDREKDAGTKNGDSGGATIFAGPTLSMEFWERFSVEAAFYFPLRRDMHGEAQELGYVWNVGAGVSW